MPVTRQWDGHSCGLLAWLALDSFLLGHQDALIESKDVADGRLKVFLQIIQRHEDEVSIVYPTLFFTCYNFV
jgi:hypothetical protein